MFYTIQFLIHLRLANIKKAEEKFVAIQSLQNMKAFFFGVESQYLKDVLNTYSRLVRISTTNSMILEHN